MSQDDRDTSAPDNSEKLAAFRLGLVEVKKQIDNTLLPLGGHLGCFKHDGDLMESLEEASRRIEAHLKRFRLVAEERPRAAEK